MKINHVAKILIMSDFFMNAGFAIITPIFAIFVTDQIVGGSIRVVGFAYAIMQIFKSGLQIPIAQYLDKKGGEYDDFYSLMLGSILVAIVPFLYLFITTPGQVYVVQAILGVGAAFSIPPWYAIFTRHIDKLKENVEWSLDSVAMGISGAGAAAFGGILADKFGFNFVFAMAGILAIYGAVLQLKIFKDLKKKVSQSEPGTI
jgi:MFS family permease